MQSKIKRVLFLIIILLSAIFINTKTYASEIDEYGKKSVAILKVPDSWDEIDNLDVSGFVLELQLPSGDTEVFDCSKINFEVDDSNKNRITFTSDKLYIWLYSDNSISFVFREYNNYSISFSKNDFRYYNFKNDSKTYTFTTDYEILNQTLFDINKEYPSHYDLRDEIDIKVENQGGFGLCWDFAMTKALETTYSIKSGLTLDLSEVYIDYMTDSGVGRGDRELHLGGDHHNYYNEVIRSGICKEEDLPYSDKIEYDIKDVKKCEKVVLPQSAFFIKENEIELNRNKEIINKMIKEQLMNNGAVSISITFAQDHFDNESNTFFLPSYCIQDNYASHEVTIIGWDDNYSKDKFQRYTYIGNNYMTDIEPNKDGAWIVQNSWGNEYGDNGIFYLSYESDIGTVFGFLDVIPYEERNEYSYVEKEYYNYQTVKLNENQKKYFYQEYNVNSDDENITHITVANVARGKLYYIDNYEDKNSIDFDDKVFIGDFASSVSPIKYSFMAMMSGEAPLKINFVLDEPIKIKGDKFLIIVEIDGNDVKNVYLNKNTKINTYYTDDELSSSWKKCTGDLPIVVFTTSRIGGISTKSTSSSLWILLMVIPAFVVALTIIFIKKTTKKSK